MAWRAVDGRAWGLACVLVVAACLSLQDEFPRSLADLRDSPGVLAGVGPVGRPQGLGGDTSSPYGSVGGLAPAPRTGHAPRRAESRGVDWARLARARFEGFLRFWRERVIAPVSRRPNGR